MTYGIEQGFATSSTGACRQSQTPRDTLSWHDICHWRGSVSSSTAVRHGVANCKEQDPRMTYGIEEGIASSSTGVRRFVANAKEHVELALHASSC